MPPRIIPLLPGRFAAEVISHEVFVGGVGVRCATWCTEGLAALGHPEVTVTLRRADGEDEETLSLDALRFFVGLHGAVAEGGGLAVGALGEFPAGLVEGTGAYGFVCVHPGSVRDPSAPTRGLRVLVLHRDELALASTFGPWRVLARLARATRRVPFPVWWDATRPSVVHPDDAGSLLARALRVRVLGAAAWRSEETVTLRVAPEAREGLRGVWPRLREMPSFALLVDAPADADAWLVWTPGQGGVTAVRRGEERVRRMAGGFVLVMRGEGGAGDCVGSHVEDGFAFVFDGETHRALLEALVEGKAFERAPGPRGLGLRVLWAPPEVLPEGGLAVHFRGVEVWTGLGDHPAVEPEAFEGYVGAVRAAIESHFESTWFQPGRDLLVHLEIHPGRGPRASVALRPGFAHPSLNGLCARVESVAMPAVTGPVVFRVECALWGGAG